MEYKKEFELESFEAWSGGATVKEEIIAQDRIAEAQELIEEIFFGEIPTETEVNDYIWFYLADALGLYDE